MKHEFNKVAILCTTDEQIRHLATMVDEVVAIEPIENKTVYFRAVSLNRGLFSNYINTANKPVVTYEEFIAGMNEQVV